MKRVSGPDEAIIGIPIVLKPIEVQIPPLAVPIEIRNVPIAIRVLPDIVQNTFFTTAR